MARLGAIFAVTDEPFLVFTANGFAILGLRAMYFLLADLIHRFVYVPTTVSLAVVATIIGTSIWLSLRATRGQGRRALQPPANPPFAVATPGETATLDPMWPRRRRGRGPGGDISAASPRGQRKSNGERERADEEVQA